MTPACWPRYPTGSWEWSSSARRCPSPRRCPDGGTRSPTRSIRPRGGPSSTSTTGAAHYPEFARFFFEQVFTEPHSTKPIEDTVGWALETDPDTLILIETATVASELRRGDTFRTLCQQIACPTVVIVGAEDAVTATGPGPGPG